MPDMVYFKHNLFMSMEKIDVLCHIPLKNRNRKDLINLSYCGWNQLSAFLIIVYLV